MLTFLPLDTTSPGAIPVGGKWCGMLLFATSDFKIQKIVPCRGLRDAEMDALEDARILHSAIAEGRSPFEIEGYKFSLKAVPWEDGFRGAIIVTTRGDTNRVLTASAELLSLTYQKTYEQALFEAYAEAHRIISEKKIQRLLDSPGTEIA